MPTLKIKSLRLITEKRTNCEVGQILTSHDVFEVMQKLHITDKPQEYTYIIGMDISNNVNCIANISKGGINNATVDPRIVFQYLYLSNSTKFIMVHNHPSGALHASKDDIQITKRLHKMACLLDFELLDHIIVTQNGFTSMKQQGMI